LGFIAESKVFVERCAVPSYLETTSCKSLCFILTFSPVAEFALLCCTFYVYPPIAVSLKMIPDDCLLLFGGEGKWEGPKQLLFVIIRNRYIYKRT